MAHSAVLLQQWNTSAFRPIDAQDRMSHTEARNFASNGHVQSSSQLKHREIEDKNEKEREDSPLQPKCANSRYQSTQTRPVISK